MTLLRIAELCAGTGGFALGIQQACPTAHVVYANDFSPASKIIYDANFNDVKSLPSTGAPLRGALDDTDIFDINISDIPAHDILTAGFPCQPFSVAGKRQGFDDARSNVFWKILEILKYHTPPIAILENVKNLSTHDNGNTFRTIVSELEGVGYTVSSTVLNTSAFLPQNRERIYIVCVRGGTPEFKIPIPTSNSTSLASVLESDVADKYYYTDKLKVWETVRDAVIKENTVYQYRRVYVRENKNGVCPTLTANMGQGGHNVPLIKDRKGIRKLTPRECFNLQGFPQDYILPTNLKDTDLYKLAGNAISVPIVKYVMGQILRIKVLGIK